MRYLRSSPAGTRYDDPRRVSLGGRLEGARAHLQKPAHVARAFTGKDRLPGVRSDFAGGFAGFAFAGFPTFAGGSFPGRLVSRFVKPAGRRRPSAVRSRLLSFGSEP